MREEIELTVLITFAIALISIGIDLIREGVYEFGIILVALGICVLVLYFVFVKNAFKKLIKREAGYKYE